MAEAFQEAGIFDGTYDEGQQAEAAAEERADTAEQADTGEQAEREGGQEQQGQDTLEDIVEDLKRKNAGE
jgi:hypothetical protein